MFIFLVGIVGILAVFPVAMNSAGRAITETRGNVLAQSAIAQLTADCRVNYEPGLAGGYASVNSSADATHFTRLNPVTLAAARVGYFVTLVNGAGQGQSRLITADDGPM